jgi:hypothetical protein
MDIIYSTQLAIPLYQVGLLLVCSTLGLLFRRAKLALMIDCLFVLYWGYWLNREALLGKGTPSVLDSFTLCYFGFGLVMAVLAVIGLLNRPE